MMKVIPSHGRGRKRPARIDDGILVVGASIIRSLMVGTNNSALEAQPNRVLDRTEDNSDGVKGPYRVAAMGNFIVFFLWLGSLKSVSRLGEEDSQTV